MFGYVIESEAIQRGVGYFWHSELLEKLKEGGFTHLKVTVKWMIPIENWRNNSVM